MRSGTPTSVLTGMGAVSGAGAGVSALWRLVAEGRSAIRPVDRPGWDPQLAGALAAMVPGRPGVLRFAVDAAREALHARPGLDRRLGGLVVGTTMGSDLEDIGALAADLGDELSIGGPRLTVSTACCSSTAAIGVAADLVAAGVVPWALAGGAEELTTELYAGFHALGVVASEPCAPLSLATGLSLGEGAGFVLVEPGGTPGAMVAILGSGLSCDAHHPTAPHPRGRGVAAALRGALAERAVAPESVAYVNLHGTGTAANDGAECMGVAAALGAHAEGLPASSTKGHIGHAQAAAGVLELIATLEARRRGRVPPTLGCDRPRPRLRLDPVPGPSPRPLTFDRWATLNAAFGGANAAVVLGDPCAPSAVLDDRPVYVRQVAVVRPEETERRESAFRRRIRGVDPRQLDPPGSMLAMAAAEALGEQRVAPDRRGLFLGVGAASPAGLREFRESIEQRGLLRVSAPAFGRLVLHAPAGAAARALDLRGPSTTLSLGPASGLLAVAHAAQWLAERRDAEVLVAGTVDEREGAVAIGLGLTPGPGGRAVRVTSWRLEGPGAAAEDLVPSSPLVPCRAFCEAVERLREGGQECARVVADAPRLGRVTVDLQAEMVKEAR